MNKLGIFLGSKMYKLVTVEMPGNVPFAEPRCCCECIRIRKGTLIIGILGLVCLVFTVMKTTLMDSLATEDFVDLFSNLLLLIPLIIFFVGLKKENY